MMVGPFIIPPSTHPHALETMNFADLCLYPQAQIDKCLSDHQEREKAEKMSADKGEGNQEDFTEQFDKMRVKDTNEKDEAGHSSVAHRSSRK